VRKKQPQKRGEIVQAIDVISGDAETIITTPDYKAPLPAKSEDVYYDSDDSDSSASSSFSPRQVHGPVLSVLTDVLIQQKKMTQKKKPKTKERRRQRERKIDDRERNGEVGAKDYSAAIDYSSAIAAYSEDDEAKHVVPELDNFFILLYLWITSLQSNSSCFKRVKGGARALLSGLVRNSS
jgi:hypothetical protein